MTAARPAAETLPITSFSGGTNNPDDILSPSPTDFFNNGQVYQSKNRYYVIDHINFTGRGLAVLFR